MDEYFSQDKSEILKILALKRIVCEKKKKKNSMWKCSVILFFFEDFFKLEKHCMSTKIQTI